MIWAFLLKNKIYYKMEIKTSKTYKGTRIVFGETAKNKRRLLNQMIEILESYGYQEMMIPVIQLTETFASKVGEENNNMMYTFTDRGIETFVWHRNTQQ